MTSEEIAQRTGLSLNESMLAKKRDFGEPFIFTGRPDERFLKAIEASGLHWTQGRLYHIMGNHDKGKAVQVLKDLYEQSMGSVTTVGLGDGFNDLPLLDEVDHPVLIRQENGSYDERINIPGLYKTQGRGPSGWNEAVQRWLANEQR
jgi:mannosyl-3-phosphoglycerate phosphatase